MTNQQVVSKLSMLASVDVDGQQGQSSVPTTQPGGAPKKKARKDIGVVRSQMLNKYRKNLEQLEKKVQGTNEAAAVEMQRAVDHETTQGAPVFSTLRERVNAALAWHGNELDTAPKFVDAQGKCYHSELKIDLKARRAALTPQNQELLKMDSRLFDHIFNTAVANMQLQCSVDTSLLMSQASMNEVINSFAACTTEDDLEKACQRFDKAKSAMTEFSDSIKGCMTELKRNTNSILQSRNEVQESERSARETQILTDTSRDLRRLRRQRDAAGLARIYKQDFQGEDHVGIPNHMSKEALAIAFHGDVVSQTNFPYVACLAVTREVFKEKLLEATFNDFYTQFPTSPTAIKDEKVAAPMWAAHGKAHLGPVWKAAMPKEHLPKQTVARLDAVAFKEWLCGYTMVSQDFEPEMLGSMKLFFKGQAKIILVPGSSLDWCGGGDSELNSVAAKFRSYLASIAGKPDAPKLLKDKGIICYHTIVDGDKAPILVTPPGWFQCICALNDQPVACVRVSFLAGGRDTIKNLNVAAGDDSTAKACVKPWVDLLENMAIAKS